MGNTGYKKVLTLRKYVNGVATDHTKDNDSNSVDYVAPLFDPNFCAGPQATTTTTQAPVTTQAPATTTDPRLQHNDLIAIVLSSGPGDDCSVDPIDGKQDLIYVSLSDFGLDYGTPGPSDVYTGIVRSGLNDAALYAGKYYLNNANSRTIRFLEQATSNGIPIYQASEGYFHEDSLYFTEETIYPFVTTNNGVYTVSKDSLIDPGEASEPQYHIKAEIYYDHVTSRNRVYFEFCINEDYGPSGGGTGEGIDYAPDY